MRVRAAAPPLRRCACTEHLTPIPSPPSDLKRGLVSSSEAPLGVFSTEASGTVRLCLRG